MGVRPASANTTMHRCTPKPRESPRVPTPDKGFRPFTSHGIIGVMRRPVFQPRAFALNTGCADVKQSKQRWKRHGSPAWRHASTTGQFHLVLRIVSPGSQGIESPGGAARDVKSARETVPYPAFITQFSCVIGRWAASSVLAPAPAPR